MSAPERARKRASLLVAARRCFVERGYHDTKVDDIVAAAGVAKGTFYLYFPDKRSAFSALVYDLVERIETGIEPVDVHREIEPQVRYNVRHVAAALLADADMTRILLNHAPGLDPAFEEQVRGFYAGLKALLGESLAEGQALGIVAPGDARLMASFIIGGLKETLLEHALDAVGPSVEALEDALMGLLTATFLRMNAKP